MSHVVEHAASGRAKCRGCARAIIKGTLRFGERIPNPFGEGEATLWFHPICAALKRPEPFLEALGATTDPPAEISELEPQARIGVAHARLPRFDGVERAASGRATCRDCREPIAKGDWRIRLAFFEEGRFEPGGFIHTRCVGPYAGTTDVLARLRCFSSDLDAAAWDEIAGIVADSPISETKQADSAD